LRGLSVGGGAGGATAAARLRRLDERAEIVLFERGEYISFANCGLPYYIGGEIREKAALTLQTPQSFSARFRVDVRTRQEVVSIDPAKREVTVEKVESGIKYTESYDKLILSPGAAPVIPPVEGIDDERVFTLRNIPDTYHIKDYLLSAQPKQAVVVGGGFIGLEMAENLTEAGIEVTVVELADRVLGNLDYEMACEVHAHLREKGVRLELGNALLAVGRKSGRLLVELADGARLPADLLILAAGVRPQTQLARDAGLRLNPKGAIIVDEKMRTSNPDIYAVGDAVEVTNPVTGGAAYIPLAGPANKQGRIAADQICGRAGSVYGGTQGSAILKLFGLTIASTGLTEGAAKAAGLETDKVYTFAASHATYYPGAEMMSVKTVYAKKTGRILGVQIVGGAGVDKRCDLMAVAIRAKMSAHDLTRMELCYAPPYSSAKDPVNMVGYVIENVMEGLYKQFFWHDVDALPRDGSVTLLDVRSPRETAAGKIEGFRNIPLDELRGHISELDPGKPVYLHCHSGQRSYIACRILAGHGFDCYNLAGGWRLYGVVKQVPMA
jgi:NADPH-dependent 2,4-dienoyl-CoA reductase/sulfur reductase-like enzyme/rhodanese-related sulfurtransferase